MKLSTDCQALSKTLVDLWGRANRFSATRTQVRDPTITSHERREFNDAEPVAHAAILLQVAHDAKFAGARTRCDENGH